MPPEIRRLADQYLYDPVTVKVQTATLTVETVEQFALEVRAREKADKLVKVLEAERPTRRSCSCAPRCAATSCTGRCGTGA